jgi:hypothetical protein
MNVKVYSDFAGVSAKSVAWSKPNVYFSACLAVLSCPRPLD